MSSNTPALQHSNKAIMAASHAKDTVLVVDDSEKNLQILSAMLYDYGVNVIMAQNGAEALASIEKKRPDLILLDIMMPGMDGLSVCERLKQHDETHMIPIIFLTAKTGQADILRGFEMGAVDYITKPFHAPELLARVHTHLELTRARNTIVAQNDLLIEQNQRLEEQNAEIRELSAQKERYLSEALHERVKELHCLFGIARLVERPNLSLADIFQGIAELIPPAWQYSDMAGGRIVFEQHEYATTNFRVTPWGQRSPIWVHGQQLGFVEVCYFEECPHADEGPFLKEERHLLDAIAERTACIVESWRATENLRKREQQYRLLAENVADGIGIIQDGYFVFANDALCNIMGYSAQRIVGAAPGELFRQEERVRIDQVLTQLERGMFHDHLQARCITGDGHEIWIEERHSLIDWEGRSAIIMTVRDITEQKCRELAVEEEKERLNTLNVTLRTTMKERYRLSDIIGKSMAMQTVYEHVLRAAASDANVVIYGESGTGKELVAWTIHRLSKRGKHVFVPVNCGAIPETLFESEFFGHRKGAFTGAHRDKPGILDHARSGTLFLDEVAELTPTMQVKLLRALASDGYSPLGSHAVKATDVHLIAATNQNLADMVEQDRMREDFYYRIAVIPITLPPLRERKEDIPLLVDYFLEKFSEDDKSAHLPGTVRQQFYDYDWPGNVRELQNALQRYLTTQYIDFIAPRAISDNPFKADLAPPDVSDRLTLSQALASFERQYLLQVLEHYRWHRGKAAAFLGIDPKTLYRKLKHYQVE